MVCRVQRPISIPEPTNDVDSLWRTTQVLKEAVEIIQGIRGNREYALKCDLESLDANVTNIAVGGGGIGTDTLVALLDTDLTGQLQYDLFYNIDGTNWGATVGKLQWNPDDEYLQLVNDHSINWVDSILSSVQLLNFRNDSFYVGNLGYPLELRGTFVGIPFSVGVNWDNSLGVNVELLDFSGLPGTPATPTTWAAIDTFSQVSSSEFLMTETWAFKFNDDGTRGYGTSASFGNGFRRSGVYSTPYLPEDTADPPELVLNGQFACFAWGDAGAKVYLAQSSGGNIDEYANSGTAYNPASGDLTFTDSFNPTALGAATSITWKPDGTKVWLGAGGFIYGYDVPTAWDLSSASTTETDSYNFNSDRVGNIEDWLIDPSGTVVYVLQQGFVYEYSLSTAWDTTTHSYESRSINGATGTAGGGVRGLDLSPDGATLVIQSQWGNNRFNNDTVRWTSTGSTPGTPATEGDTVFTVGDPAYPTEIDGTKVGLKSNIGINWDNDSGVDVELLNFLPGATGVDPNFAEVVVKLPFDGADGATTSSDESSFNQTIIFEGGAELDTAQAISGFSSVLFAASADVVKINALGNPNTDLDLADNNFTIELAARFVSLTGGSGLISDWHIANSKNWTFAYTTSALQFAWTLDGNNVTSPTFDVSWTPSLNQWYRIAITREGAALRLYVDGIRIGENLTAIGTEVISWQSGSQWRIGHINNAGVILRPHDGWIDEVRVTIGTARYTGDSYSLTEAFTVGDPGYATQIDGSSTTITSASTILEGTASVVGNTQFDADVNIDGALSFAGKMSGNVTTVITTSHTAGDEHVILVDDDTAAAAVTVTLPAAVTANTIYHVKKIGTTAEVIIDGSGSETIDGELTITLRAQYESVMLVSNGTFWSIL